MRVFDLPGSEDSGFFSCRARRKTSLSGRKTRNRAAEAEMQALVLNCQRQPTCEIRYRLTIAAMRYPPAYPCCKIPLPRPRASTGRFSRAEAEAKPQMPPIPTPKRLRTARNCWKVRTKLQPRERQEMRRRLKTKGHFRPKRSETRPKATCDKEG